VLISCAFLAAFGVTLLKIISALHSDVIKLKNSVTEITTRLTKVELFVTDINKTVASIESLKGVLVETSEINKNIVGISVQFMSKMDELNKNIDKNTDALNKKMDSLKN
jgi:t-SNARE complex subunit (syntaxin)